MMSEGETCLHAMANNTLAFFRFILNSGSSADAMDEAGRSIKVISEQNKDLKDVLIECTGNQTAQESISSLRKTALH